MIRGRKLKEKGSRNRAPSESQSRLSKKLSRSSDEGDKVHNQPIISPFDYQIQNDTYCHEDELLPPLPDSIPSTPASSIILPDKPGTPENAPRSVADLQPTVEDEAESSTPKPIPPIQPSQPSSSIEIKSKKGIPNLQSNQNVAPGDIALAKREMPTAQKLSEGFQSSPGSTKGGVVVKTRRQSTEYQQPRPISPHLAKGKLASSPSVSPIPQYHYPYMNYDPFYSPTQHPAMIPAPSTAPPTVSSPAQALTLSPRAPESFATPDASSMMCGYGYATHIPFQPPQTMYSHSYYGMPYPAMNESQSQPQSQPQLKRKKSKDNRATPRAVPDDESATLVQQVSSAVIGMKNLLERYQAARTNLSVQEQQSQETEGKLLHEIEDLKRQLNATKSEFNRVLSDTIIERNTARTGSISLRAEVEQLVRDRTESTLENGALRSEVEQLSGERDQARNQCKLMSRDIERFKRFVQECEALRIQNSSLQDRLKDEGQLLASVKRERDEVLAVRTTLEQSLKNLLNDHALQKESHTRMLKDEQEKSQREILALKELHSRSLFEEKENSRKQMLAKGESHERVLTEEQEKSRQQLITQQVAHNRLLKDEQDRSQRQVLAEQESHKRALLEEQKKSRQQLDAQRESHDRRLREEQEQLQRQILSQKESHDLALSKEQERFRQQLQTARISHERLLKDEQESSKRALESKSEELSRAAANHKIEVSRATAEAFDLRKKYNSMCSELDDSRLNIVELKRQVESKRKEGRDAAEKHRLEIVRLNRDFEAERRDMEKKWNERIIGIQQAQVQHVNAAREGEARSKLDGSFQDGLQQAVLNKGPPASAAIPERYLQQQQQRGLDGRDHNLPTPIQSPVVQNKGPPPPPITERRYSQQPQQQRRQEEKEHQALPTPLQTPTPNTTPTPVQ
ncbi:MAG: hypothetical protein Q9160_004550, partial [Pyrenula sp. 1 TL-2023]